MKFNEEGMVPQITGTLSFRECFEKSNVMKFITFRKGWRPIVCSFTVDKVIII